MPKTKKRKTTHHRSSASNGDLSQAEIWDDSALIRSWNDALAEYEFYHSIHALGEDVEEILRQAEEAEEAEEAESAARKHALQNQSVKDEANLDHHNGSEDDAEVEEGEVADDDGTSNDHPSRSRALASNELNQSINLDSSTRAAASIDSTAPGHTADVRATDRPAVTINGPTEPVTTSDIPLALPTVDQTLENIKMAYYWAGYYSGLHDGQKQVSTQHQDAHANNGADRVS